MYEQTLFFRLAFGKAVVKINYIHQSLDIYCKCLIMKFDFYVQFPEINENIYTIYTSRFSRIFKLSAKKKDRKKEVTCLRSAGVAICETSF